MTKDRDRLQSLTNKSCPVGWTMFSGSFYFLSSLSDSWTNARRDCQNKGADLVVIDSLKEQNFLSELINVDTWIGLSDRDKEGTWKWVDESPLIFTNWDNGEPNNLKPDGEDCAEIRVQKGHKWNDKPCELSQRWICEKKCNTGK
ncbi:hypothetical protein Q5P01_013925 [Channa striata]|uniref:C-type lectin domain-containing protein n=1 Tax=Channa striata TaxID=64152 RepID=A0AA88MNT7_CHASR|nr:hypothetical protein Q5P01_013925 [Channa striata]